MKSCVKSRVYGVIVARDAARQRKRSSEKRCTVGVFIAIDAAPRISSSGRLVGSFSSSDL